MARVINCPVVESEWVELSADEARQAVELSQSYGQPERPTARITREQAREEAGKLYARLEELASAELQSPEEKDVEMSQTVFRSYMGKSTIEDDDRTPRAAGGIASRYGVAPHEQEKMDRLNEEWRRNNVQAPEPIPAYVPYDVSRGGLGEVLAEGMARDPRLVSNYRNGAYTRTVTEVDPETGKKTDRTEHGGAGSARAAAVTGYRRADGSVIMGNDGMPVWERDTTPPPARPSPTQEELLAQAKRAGFGRYGR